MRERLLVLLCERKEGFARFLVFLLSALDSEVVSKFYRFLRLVAVESEPSVLVSALADDPPGELRLHYIFPR